MGQPIPSYRPKRAGKRVESRLYDRTKRDREAQRFYESRAWRRLRRLKLAANPLCEDCLKAGRLTPALHVHHERPISEAPELAYNEGNLTSLCIPCHNARDKR